jgi:hypothetical protein
MATPSITSSRRSFLAAAALAPVVIAAPAIAAQSDQNAVLDAAIARYRKAWTEYQNHPVHDTLLDDPDYGRISDEGSLVSDRSDEALEAVLRIPTGSGRDIATKLDLLVAEYENCVLPDRLIKIIADSTRRFA